jgi:uroporphyrinogen-III synthase
VRILVTRPRADAERTARRLRRLGHQPLIAPLIEIHPNPTVELGEGAPDALLVTSANALRAMERHPGRTALLGVSLLAVGERTAALARRHGFRAVTAAGGDADSLLALARTRLSGGMRVLHLAGRDLARDLTPDLAGMGVVVTLLEVYRAEPVARLPAVARDALAQGTLDAVLHLSPRSARLFVERVREEDLVPSAMRIRHLCLSPRVAAALAPLGAADVLVAGQPREAELIALVSSAGSS